MCGQHSSANTMHNRTSTKLTDWCFPHIEICQYSYIFLVYIYIYIWLCIYTCVYVYTYTHMNQHLRPSSVFKQKALTYFKILILDYLFTISIHMYIYIYIYIYTYIHIRIWHSMTLKMLICHKTQLTWKYAFPNHIYNIYV